MARKFTRESFKKLDSTGSKVKDKFLERVIWAIHEKEFTLEKQEDSIEEDEHGIEHDCVAYYGDFKDLGVTVKFLKKPEGIVGRYFIEVETDEDNIIEGGQWGAKAWRIVKKVENQKGPTFNESSLLGLLEELN